MATLPILAAYFVWTFGTIAVLHLAIRPLRLPAMLHVAVLASPAVFINAMFGQNGALTAALLIGGLLCRAEAACFRRHPVRAPHHQAASRHTRPVLPDRQPQLARLLSAAVAAAVLAMATGIFFGFGVWASFMSETRVLMTAIMEAPYPQSYHSNALTVFVMARAAGAGLGIAYALQAVATLAVIAVVTWLWLPSTPIDPRRRALATATLAVVATPYAYSYDTVPMCIALAYMFAVSARPRWGVLFAIAWLFPLFAHMLNHRGIGIGVLVPIGVALAMVLPVLMRGRAELGGDVRLASTTANASMPAPRHS